MNVRVPHFYTLKSNFAKPFLRTPLHTYTDTSSKFHVSNFNSQDILFYIQTPPFYPFLTFKFEFRKTLKLVFRYFYEECFSTIPKTILFCGQENVKNINVGDTPVLPFCDPGNSSFEKCWNRFLGMFMKNVQVQFRRQYLIVRSIKSQKHECHRYAALTL